MEANTANDAQNTTEESQVTETEIVDEVEAENNGDSEPAEDAVEAGGEQDTQAASNEEESEPVVEASAEEGNDTEKETEKMESENNEGESKEGDEAAEGKKDENGKENDKIEKGEEGKNEEEKKDESSDKVDDAKKDTEKVNYTNLAPWFNEELHRLCKKNQQMYRRAREHKNQTKMWDDFKAHQNSVHQQIRKVKRDYKEKNSLSDDDMAKLSTKSASKAREYGLLDFDVKVITDGRNLEEPENKGSQKRDHGGSWVSPQEKRRRDQVMREYYKMYY